MSSWSEHFRRARPWRMTAFLSLAAMLSNAPAWAGVLGQAPDDDFPLWRVLGALLLCLGLAVAGAFVLRGRSGVLPKLVSWTPSKRRLKLVETVRLSAQASISIVACDERELLVLASDKGAEVVECLPERVRTATPEAVRLVGVRV